MKEKIVLVKEEEEVVTKGEEVEDYLVKMVMMMTG